MNLSVQSLSVAYDSTVVVKEVSFDLPQGSAISIMGRNGMGKTTLLKGILGFLPAVGGTVTIGEERMDSRSAHRLIRRGVSYAPQEGNVFSELSVDENLAAGVLYRKPDKGRRAAILDRFPVLGRRLHQRAGVLSGGEQKMLVLARALLSSPALLVLDEISDGLQPGMVDVVRAALKEERQERATTLLLVEQNVRLALAVCDRVAIIRRGEIIFDESTVTEDVEDRVHELLAPPSGLDEESGTGHDADLRTRFTSGSRSLGARPAER